MITCSAAATSPPRTSFSHDQLPQEPDAPLPVPCYRQGPRSPEFEFSVSGSFELESSADKLFSNGVILPLSTTGHRPPSPIPAMPTNRLPPLVPPAKKDGRSFRGGLGVVGPPTGRTSPAPLPDEDADVDFPRKSMFCSFPLLPRSNSTGSAPSAKRGHVRQPSITMRKSFSVPSSLSHGNPLYRKSASGRSQGHQGLKVSPVLNFPTACICGGTANLFGLSLWFRGRGGKDKKPPGRR
ncbi:hypothetical protein MLD38_032836 [Melastoma candidum]|uniref:Uncharacterized protein n=1 Tax=Melastoma candidum TaxID=119954 RepID=A0ACB9M7B4_9MYRT|nr:hypothetical protein MLD38_032836 [Melastoma candidum]